MSLFVKLQSWIAAANSGTNLDNEVNNVYASLVELRDTYLKLNGGSMTGALLLHNASAATPALALTNDPDTGIYRIGANTIGISSNGARVGQIGDGYGGFTGNIIQMISVEKTDTFSTSSTSYTDVTGISVTITPRYSNSKILIIVSLGLVSLSTGSTAGFQIVRGSTPIGIGDAAGSRPRQSFRITQMIDGNHGGTANFTYLDSPATTSATTYKLQVQSQSATTTTINRTSTDSDGSESYQGRAASTITVMELQQ